jgi:MYXO-CTERM domain-containing protein
MTERWTRGWVRWLAGFAFGAVLGYAFFLIGLIAVLIAGLALILAIVGRWQLAFVSGWLCGVGTLWLGLMVRVVLNCSADPTCVVSSGTEAWVRISLGFLLAGVLIGIVAWRRRRHSGERPA